MGFCPCLGLKSVDVSFHSLLKLPGLAEAMLQPPATPSPTPTSGLFIPFLFPRSRLLLCSLLKRAGD